MPQYRPRSIVLVSVLFGALTGCGDDLVGPGGAPEVPPGVPTGDAMAGRVAFVEECGTCHSALDGFDVAFFSFPDTTIVRRAVHHVDTATALDIVAHIRTFDIRQATRTTRVFQPQQALLGSDLEFALGLFGQDGWPADLTTDGLLAINPRTVPVAVEFPVWSVEESNIDWMPELPVDEALLDFNGGAARFALDRYYVTRSLEDLAQAVLALRISDRARENPDAPCIEDPSRDDPLALFRSQECFEARRWTSTLVAQHMLRAGLVIPISPVLHDVWWDVGNAARRAVNRRDDFENAELNWASWMYLGWSFAPQQHASVYLGIALNRLELPRHATFVALRSQVARPRRSIAPYRDVRNAAIFSPATWTRAAVRFGFHQLLERLEAGWVPDEEEALAEAIENVEQAYDVAARKLFGIQTEEMLELRDRVLELLEQT
ncbi:MAG: hypothetical protein KAJ67_05535 [Gemmatimonadetes bacterium]|nr:hypothetical protein [Gemmatimonadota bacterium]